MRVKLMHELLQVADYIFEEWTDSMSGKELGNEFWKYCRSKFLDDSMQKIKVTDFVYNHILHLDSKEYKDKYGVNLENIKKTKDQISFVSDVVTKMMKYSNIPLVDY